MQRRALLSSGLVAVGSLAGCVGAFSGVTVTEEVSETHEVSPETVVSISNRNGDVRVDPVDGNRLTVTARKEASSEAALDSVSVEVSPGEQFTVQVDFESGSEFEARSVDLALEVPNGVRVDRASTDSGDVNVGGVAGDVAAETTNGDVELYGVDGYVTAETTNGSVTVRDATGLDGARSANGDVDADLYSLRGDVTCRTRNGDVTVAVGEDVAAAIRLETDTGSATVEGVPHTVDEERSGSVRGRVRGGGDRTVTLRSTNGDVRLEAAA